MTEKKKTALCKYFNSGYCKFQSECKYIHAKEVCSKLKCKTKRCSKRHPKTCRYGDKCKRRTVCLFKHDPLVSHTPAHHPLPPAPQTPYTLPPPSCPYPHPTKEEMDVSESDVSKLKEDIEKIKLDLEEKQDFMYTLQREIMCLQWEFKDLKKLEETSSTDEKFDNINQNIITLAKNMKAAEVNQKTIHKNIKVADANLTSQTTIIMKRILAIESKINAPPTSQSLKQPV